MILLLLSVKDATDSSKGGWKFAFQSTRPKQRESNMGKMRRLLAAVLVASMLFGTNGVSYAAETIADGASQEMTVEETTEAVTEDTESAAPAESDPSETVDAVTQTGAEDSSQDDSEAAEEVADTESDADDKAAAADNRCHSIATQVVLIDSSTGASCHHQQLAAGFCFFGVVRHQCKDVTVLHRIDTGSSKSVEISPGHQLSADRKHILEGIIGVGIGSVTFAANSISADIDNNFPIPRAIQ